MNKFKTTLPLKAFLVFRKMVACLFIRFFYFQNLSSIPLIYYNFMFIDLNFLFYKVCIQIKFNTLRYVSFSYMFIGIH